MALFQAVVNTSVLQRPLLGPLTQYSNFNKRKLPSFQLPIGAVAQPVHAIS